MSTKQTGIDVTKLTEGDIDQWFRWKIEQAKLPFTVAVGYGTDYSVGPFMAMTERDEDMMAAYEFGGSLGDQLQKLRNRMKPEDKAERLRAQAERLFSRAEKLSPRPVLTLEVAS